MNEEFLPLRDDVSTRALLRELIALRCSGLATPEQVRQLGEILVSDRNAADYYVAAISLHADLKWVACQLDLDAPDSSAELAKCLVQPVRQRRTARMLPMVLSLVVVTAGVSWLMMNRFRQDVSADVIAWQESAGERLVLRAGDRVSQSSGNGTLTFTNGVRVTLSGRAELEVMAPMKVRLNSGLVHVDAGEHGQGFTICTPTTDVVDLGTVFGVAVTPEEEANVVVFSGEVRLNHRKIRTSDSTSLLQGEAVRVQRDGQLGLLKEVWLDSVGNWSPSKQSEMDSVIAQVADNRLLEGCSKFYGIVPGGFGEDAPAYVDRAHQWNSLPGIPFPEELIGADYIRTFNDTKFRDSLEIALALAAPADVFILVDPRHETPSWLSETFEETGFQIGLDLANREGLDNGPPPPPGITTGRLLGVGAGNSVDIPFRIWKRTVPEAGEILLGPNGKPSAILLEASNGGSGSMYGIVIAPRDKSKSPADIPLASISVRVPDSSTSSVQ